MSDHHARPVVMNLVLLLLVSAAILVARESAAQPGSAPTADPLVFDTWVPGPCSPNGQPQGQCPPGDLFRVRLVRQPAEKALQQLQGEPERLAEF